MPAHGLSVRLLSRGARAVLDGLRQLWQAAKMALYDERPHLPRKVY
jgi:hypothetical protein